MVFRIRQVRIRNRGRGNGSLSVNNLAVNRYREGLLVVLSNGNIERFNMIMITCHCSYTVSKGMPWSEFGVGILGSGLVTGRTVSSTVPVLDSIDYPLFGELI